MIVKRVDAFLIICVFLVFFFSLVRKIENQSERTDRLYEMFIELLKEERK